MAIKKYNVSQRVTVNGVKRYSTFSVEMEEADLQNFLNLLEGGYSVTEVNATLTNLQHEDINVTDVNAVGKITMGATDANGHKLYAGIRPYKGAIQFKNTVSVDDIKAVLQNTTPFGLAPAEKPSRISVLSFESIASSE